MIRHNPHKIGEVYENIPCYNNGKWELISFNSREEFAETLEKDYLKEPGTYELDETIYLFKEKAIDFEGDGYYTNCEEDTLEYEDFWDFEKLKSRKGVFFFNNNKKFYLPREFYFWINYLEIVDKVKRQKRFNDIWDTQIWVALYEFIAELRYEHATVLKKRQFGSSLYHMAKIINIIWFEDAAVCKIGASLETYITGVNGCWKFLQMYRSFLNKHTAWVREMNPGSSGKWEQKVEAVENGIKVDIGNNSTVESFSFQQSDTAGVGGLTTLFFYEEAGIAPRMDKTLEFLLPAMEAGDITTGIFIAAGTVGDLDQCKPLEELTYKAKKNRIYTIRNKWVNDKGLVLETGMFVPEQYSMLPFIDKFGNSLVDQAYERMLELYKEWEENLAPEVCQIRKSQHPINMEIAFAARNQSVFPLALVNSHSLDIEDGKYPYELIDLEEDVNGKIVAKLTFKPPITEYPIDKKASDKTGTIVVYERPDENPEWGTYYASVDPVKQGKSTTSESLCSIHVYKNPIQVTRFTDGRAKTFVEGDKIVAAWCGRFDDLNDTHKRLELIIKWYNAWTLVEANVSQFIIHMIHYKLQRYLVPKNEMVFLKDHGHNTTGLPEYGWKNTGRIFYDNLLPYLIDFLKEKIYEETDTKGNVVKTHYGITRIPDIMVMKEMKKYTEGMNVDRLISLATLISFVKIQNANRGFKKKIESDEPTHLDNSDKFSNLNTRSPFSHIGKPNRLGNGGKSRNPFRNMN